MATDLRLSVDFQNLTTDERLRVTVDIATTGDHIAAGRLSIGTSEETISIPADIGDAGQMVLINRDDTNYVKVGISTGAYFGRLLPGVPAVVGLEPAIDTLYLVADTADCDVQYLIHEA